MIIWNANLTFQNFNLFLTLFHSVGGVVQTGGTGQVIDTIRRHEVDTVLANQREIVGASREIK